MASWRIRSILFVPGTRHDRFATALNAGADAVCFDLEDAVPPDCKDDARRIIRAFPTAPSNSVQRYLRINSLSTRAGLLDLIELTNVSIQLDGLVLPKVTSAGEIRIIRSTLGAKLPVIAMVETAAGIEAAAEIAAHAAVCGLMFGSADYANEIGSTLDWDALTYARGRVVAAAALHKVAAIDGAWPDVHDGAGLLADTRRIKSLGFCGRAAIHPRQIAAIHRGFAPSPQELARARRIVEAFERAGGEAILVDGRMIDRPLYEAAVATTRSADQNS